MIISILNYIVMIAVLLAVALLLGAYLLCAAYSRIMKKHEVRRLRSNAGSGSKANDSNVKRSGKSGIKEYISGLCRYMTIVTGRIPSTRIRRMLYRHVFCMEVHKKAVIFGGCEFRSPWNIKIGKSVIGLGSILDGRNGIEIKDNVCTATECYIWTEQHDINDPDFGASKKTNKKVVIDEHAWITSRTTILPGVHVHEGAVVSAGSVVTKDCEAFSVYAGIPAKKIADRNHDLTYELCRGGVYHFY